MLQRVDIFHAKTKTKIFGLSLSSTLSNEKVVNLGEELAQVVEEWKEKKLRRTKKKLIDEIPVFFVPKDDYIFALLVELNDKPKEFESEIEALYTMLKIQTAEEDKIKIESDLKKTLTDAMSLKLGVRKKKKEQLKPLSVYRERSKEKRTKFFLVGLGKAGKSSIYYQFFENWSEEQLESITATIGVSQKKVDDNQSSGERLLINDLGGQEQFREAYFSEPSYFHGAMGIIFIVDCQETENIEKTETYFKAITEQIDTDPSPHRPLISIFIHKYDPNRRKELEQNIFDHWMPSLEKVFRKYNPAYFLTSIYDNTAREAMARFFLQAMPNYLLGNVINSEMILSAARSIYPILDQLKPAMDDDINKQVVEIDLYESAQQFGIQGAKRVTKQWHHYLLDETPEDAKVPKEAEGDLNISVENTGKFRISLKCPIPVDQRRSELCAITHGLFTGFGRIFGYFHVDMIETEIRDKKDSCKFIISD